MKRTHLVTLSLSTYFLMVPHFSVKNKLSFSLALVTITIISRFFRVCYLGREKVAAYE